MRIVLINVPNTYELVGNDPVIIKDQQGIYPPLGLLYTSAYINQKGRHHVDIIDCQAENLNHAECAEKVKSLKPDLIGLTAMTFTLVDCKLVIQEIRRRTPGIPIVVGGPHTAIFPDETMNPKGLGADYVVVGEGEITLNEFATDLEMGKPKGRIYRQVNFIQNLDELPFADYDAVDINNYYSVLAEETPSVTLFTCHDDKTDVLTEKGFKLFSELNKEDRLITYNLEKQVMEPKEIKGITKKLYEGEMIHIKSSTSDIMVTPNHRMLLQKSDKNNEYGEFEFETAEKMYCQERRRLMRFGEWIGEEPSDTTIKFRTGNHQRTTLEINLGDFMEFIGYYISEGNSWFIRNNRNKPMYRVKITQSLKANPVTYSLIDKCITKMGFKYYKCDTQFEISCKELYEYLKPLGLCDKKYIPEYFKSLTRPYLLRLFNALQEGDGYKNINKFYGTMVFHYTTTSKKLANDVQEISLKLGYGSTVVSKSPRKGAFIRGREIISQLPAYTVTTYDRIHVTPHKRNYSKVKYKGYIYCAETDNETLVTRRNGKVITLGNSRGCPFSCAYCDRPALGKGFRPQSANRVVAEMESCEKRGAKEIFFYDDTFSVSMKRVMEICNEYKRRNLTIKWDIRTRVNVVNEELLKNMKEAGCERIHFGVESGNPRVVRVMNKGISIKQVEQGFDLCKKYGIKTLAYFMLGNPTETFDDVKDTLVLSKRIKPDFMQMTILSPFPATKYYMDAMNSGVIKSDVWKEYAANIQDNFRPPLWDEIYTRSELESQLRWFYGKFYLTPEFVWERIKELRNFGQFKRYATAGMGLLKMTLIPEGKLKDSWRLRNRTGVANSAKPEAAVAIN